MKQNTKINIKNTKKTQNKYKNKKNTKLRKRTYKKTNRKHKKVGGVKRSRDEDDYEYDNQYDIFLNNIDFINENDGQCRSTRSNNLSLKTVSLGSTDKTNFVSSKAVDYDDLTKFVYKDIDYGPQIVSIPVPPYRHAFLVNILQDKIMISDWRGNSYMGRKKEKYVDFTQYSDFMELLKEKYPGRPIKFYIVNKVLYDISYEKNENFDGGGCSEYIYRWVEGILLNDRKNGTNFFSM
jgi:hypothetical protein